MKTGRLLKFQRPGGEIHAYLYHDTGVFHAAVYLISKKRGPDRDPLHSIAGANGPSVEQELRAWVDAHFPRKR